MNRSISFDLQNTAASHHMYFCERRGQGDYIEIGNVAFFDRLKALPDSKTQILLYIHGFNNTDEAVVFPRAQRLQALFDQVGGAALVHVVPLIWPCDDDRFTAIADDYWDDQRAADQSGVAFARMLGKFDEWRRKEALLENPCMRRINVLAHSMGNRVLRNTLKTWVENEGSGAMPQLFRNVFMVAADVVNHTLEADEEGEHIPPSCRNLIVYYANDDLAMPASKVANLRNRTVSRRLGMTGPEDLEAVPKNVYEVDCDSFNNTCDSPKGHSYFFDCPGGKVSPVIGHMVEAIKDGRVDPPLQHHVLPKP
ncbi:MAG: alpha/beta hydrolase [Nitrococcus mobilis]|nr:alpha/beta hydrolase [Nitrococcus mobilis]